MSDIDFHFLSLAELLLGLKRKDTCISSKKQGKQSNSNHLGIFYLLLVHNILCVLIRP